MNVRLFIIAGIPILGLIVLLAALGIGGRELAERTIEYRGEQYTGPVVASQREVDGAGAEPTDDRLQGKQVFAEDRTPPRALFLLRTDGRFDAYVLARDIR